MARYHQTGMHLGRRSMTALNPRGGSEGEHSADKPQRGYRCSPADTLAKHCDIPGQRLNQRHWNMHEVGRHLLKALSLCSSVKA